MVLGDALQGLFPPRKQHFSPVLLLVMRVLVQECSICADHLQRRAESPERRGP